MSATDEYVEACFDLEASESTAVPRRIWRAGKLCTSSLHLINTKRKHHLRRGSSIVEQPWSSKPCASHSLPLPCTPPQVLETPTHLVLPEEEAYPQSKGDEEKFTDKISRRYSIALSGGVSGGGEEEEEEEVVEEEEGLYLRLETQACAN